MRNYKKRMKYSQHSMFFEHFFVEKAGFRGLYHILFVFLQRVSLETQDIVGSTLPITTSDKRANLQRERRRIVRRRFDDCRGLW